MPYIAFFVAAFMGLAPALAHAADNTLAKQLAGRIVLQVESHGEAFYIHPVELKRYYLGRPADAFYIMQTKGLGIRHQELQSYLQSRFPARLSGRIMLDVESHGEAYYVNPLTLQAHYLSRPGDAHMIMRAQGLGISNQNIAKIPLAAFPALPAPSPAASEASVQEAAAFERINDYRSFRQLPRLSWDSQIAEVARAHSQNMASGIVPFGHEGFDGRAARLREKMRFTTSAENVGYAYGGDSVEMIVNGWFNSASHRTNIESPWFNKAAIGGAVSANGTLYLTQIFLAP